MNMLTKMICGFVEKSGGIEKVERAAQALKNIPKGQYADFLGNLAKREEGAQQLIAAAIAGFSLSAFVYKNLREPGGEEPRPN